METWRCHVITSRRAVPLLRGVGISLMVPALSEQTLPSRIHFRQFGSIRTPEVAEMPAAWDILESLAAWVWHGYRSLA